MFTGIITDASPEHPTLVQLRRGGIRILGTTT